MNKNIMFKDFQKILKYKFKDEKILVNCITHPSFDKEPKLKNNQKINEFERLEFLGDRVLGLIISSLIYQKFPEYDEGSLTKKFSYLVQKEFLYKIARELQLDLYLRFKNKNLNERRSKSILSDSVESIIGGIFIDGGFNKVFSFVKRIWMPYLDIEESNKTDPKTRLQEISQKKFKNLPQYKLLSKKGPPHSPIFTISLKALNLKAIKSSAGSIRDAEKIAAEKILDLINE
tara:strand:- start:272 stop:967 length:696 start_codon:yes stop_codon:yes gene_type:complete